MVVVNRIPTICHLLKNSETNLMKCPHCSVEYYATSNPSILGQDISGVWQVDFKKCPSCNNAIITLINGKYSQTPAGFMGNTVQILRRLLPLGLRRANVHHVLLRYQKQLQMIITKRALFFQTVPKLLPR